MLGPLLFLLHINDLPSVVNSTIRFFADDCLIYRPIRSREDQVILQGDLDSLERWSDIWGMKFNPSKCNIMSIARSRSPFTHLYIHFVVRFCPQYLRPGILVTDELSWSSHVQSISSKANSTLGFLHRNLRRCPAKLKENAPHWNMPHRYGTLTWPRTSTS